VSSPGFRAILCTVYSIQYTYRVSCRGSWQKEAKDQFSLNYNQVLRVQFQLNPRRVNDKIEFRTFLYHDEMGEMGQETPNNGPEAESVYTIEIADFIHPLNIHTIFVHPHNAAGEGGHSRVRLEWDNRFAWWHSKSVDFRVTRLTDNSWQPVWEDFDDAERKEMAYYGKAGAVPITSVPDLRSKLPSDETEKELGDESTLTIETADIIRQTGPPRLLRPSRLNTDGREFCQKAGVHHLLPIVSACECIRGEIKRKFVLAEPLSYNCGSNGMVVHYISDSEDPRGDRQRVSIKHTYVLDELRMTMQQERSGGRHCGHILCRSMVPNKVSVAMYPPTARRSGSVYMHLIAMPTYTGDLEDFCEHENDPLLSVDTISRIVLDVKAQLDCLLKHDMCYMDIKPQNVLYVLQDKTDVQSLRVVLCDVNMMEVSSFNCPFSAEPNFPVCAGMSIHCQNFNLCMLALLLHMGTSPTRNRTATFWVQSDMYEQFPRSYILEVVQEMRDTVSNTFPPLRDLTRGWPDE